METVWSKAADIIRERGFAKGFESVSEQHGPACIGIAVDRAANSLGSRDTSVDGSSISHKLWAKIGVSNAFGLISWNDEPERTVEDVLRVLQELHDEEVANVKS